MSDLFFGNVSTDNEVRTLLETFKGVKDGTLITYKKVAEIVDVEVESTRFRTITNRWRKIMLSQFNIELRARAKEGFVALTASERVTANINDGLRLFKRVERTVGKLRCIPRYALEGHDTARLDHATTLMARVANAASDAKKELAPPAPHRLLTRRPVPSEA